jgi:hypothetical protein
VFRRQRIHTASDVLAVGWLLHKLPISEAGETIWVRGRPLELPADRILVWVTLCRKGSAAYDLRAPLVPAILDTGFNGNFAIREEQFVTWGGLDPTYFGILGSDETPRGPAVWCAANLWLHRNKRGSREPSRAGPLRLELDRGLMVYLAYAGPSDLRPALPVLGLRALRRNELCVAIDSRRNVVSVSKPRLLFIPLSV